MIYFLFQKYTKTANYIKYMDYSYIINQNIIRLVIILTYLKDNLYYLYNNKISIKYSDKVIRMIKDTKTYKSIQNVITYFRCLMYDFYIGNNELETSTPRLYEEFLLKECKDNYKILEIGVGNGTYFKNDFINNIIRTKNIIIDGIDIDEQYIKDCKDVIKNKSMDKYIRVECVDLFRYISLTDYDIILFSESAPLMSKSLIVSMLSYIDKNIASSKTKIMFINNLTENSSETFRFIKKNIKYLTLVDFGETLDIKFFNDINTELNDTYNVSYYILKQTKLEVLLNKLFKIPTEYFSKLLNSIKIENTDIKQYIIIYEKK